MFSPHDSQTSEEWFRRFDAASRRLPAEERISQREEIRQHLEGLVAAKTALGQSPEAAWTSALKQFGDPTLIGLKMSQEWQQGRVGFRADMKAILFGVGLMWLLSIVTPLCAISWSLWVRSYGTGGFNGEAPQLPHTVYQVLIFGGVLLICITVGRKYPLQSIRAAFYSSLLWGLTEALQLVVFNMHNRAIFPQPLSAVIAHALLWAPIPSAAGICLLWPTSS